MLELAEVAFNPVSEGSRVALHVQPGARRSAVVGMHGDAVKIALQAPPVDGKANRALCRMIAKCCGIPAGAVTILSGESSRNKVLKVSGIAPDQLKIFLEKSGS